MFLLICLYLFIENIIILKMKKSVVILLCMLNIFLFNSCKDKNKSTFSPQLEYISISCNHTNYDYCYSFTAYTKDSKAYFSADCTIENFELNSKHIEFENKKIAYNEFLKIQNFAKKIIFIIYIAIIKIYHTMLAT